MCIVKITYFPFIYRKKTCSLKAMHYILKNRFLRNIIYSSTQLKKKDLWDVNLHVVPFKPFYILCEQYLCIYS